MIDNTAPYDLNIPVNCGANTTPTILVKRALALGYRTVALNVQVVTDNSILSRLPSRPQVSQSQFLTRKQAKDKSKTGPGTLSDFPPPPTVQLSPQDYPELARRGLAPTILTRLTISITSNDFLLHYNKSSVAKQYDLLAINLTTAPCLLALLKSGFRWDILSFSPSEVEMFQMKWTRKLYYECVDKNVYLELPYAALIRDREERRRVISQAHNYHSVGKSRNIILTSGATEPLQLRASTDVANLAFILGLTANQGVDSVGVTSWACHKSAVGRRMGPFQVRVEKLPAHEQTDGESDSGDGSEDSGSQSDDMETD